MVVAERVLVTGATGYTGGHLCDRLVAEGYSVRALVREPNGSADLHSRGVEVAVGDLRNARSLEQAVNGIDVVYHIAALFRTENVSRNDMWETNAQGPQDLLDASIKAGVQRFVHCSTVGVHGNIKNPPANEEAPYSPGDHYQKSKTEGERRVLKYMKEGLVPTVVFRPTGIYGPGDMRWLKLIKAIKSRMYFMVGSGEVLFHAVYIDDLIDGIIRCGTREEAVGNVYILGGEHPITLNQMYGTIAEELNVRPIHIRVPFAPVYAAGYLCELIFKPLGINPPLYRRRVKFFKNTRWFDISKAKNDLGFKPAIDMKTGIHLTVEWYRENGWL